MSRAQVAIGIPVRNSGPALDGALDTVTGQTHADLEIVISDNASDDDTEEICREHARRDPRIRYHRQSVDLGVHGNFTFVMRNATAPYFRWVGDDDRLDPTYVARCLDVLVDDPRLVLATTQQSYREADGQIYTEPYGGTALGSPDAVDRFAEMLRLLNASHRLIDPMYGLMRRNVAVALPRRTRLGGDQVYAARLAMAGPWAHLHDVLAHREWPHTPHRKLAKQMGLPRWHPYLAAELQAKELLAVVADADLTATQRRTAQRAVGRWYVTWHRRRFAARRERLVRRIRGLPGQRDRTAV